jgi:hypothetical protein
MNAVNVEIWFIMSKGHFFSAISFVLKACLKPVDGFSRPSIIHYQIFRKACMLMGLFGFGHGHLATLNQCKETSLNIEGYNLFWISSAHEILCRKHKKKLESYIKKRIPITAGRVETGRSKT